VFDSSCQLADSCRVFDMAYFGGAFAERVREFTQDHNNAHVRLELVTLNGERLDALQLRADEKGTSISTRDDRLVFLPYSLIAYVDVAILRDHRIPGFQLSVGSEARPRIATLMATP
jgi:hypothetical protein